jgi:cell shape-determining protein MreD
VVVYGGVAFLVIGFTAYALYSADSVLRPDAAWFRSLAIWLAMATYALLVIIVALSWGTGMRMIKRGRSEILTRAKLLGGNPE